MYNKVVKQMVSPPQNEPVLGKAMVKNRAGGYVFEIDKWSKLSRFLILGSADNTYYVTAKDLTKENIGNILDCIKEEGRRVVDECVRVSDQGLAPKNDPAIFALAISASLGDVRTKAYAFSQLDKVCRISTHIMKFAEYCNTLRGWGRSLRNGIANWYDNKPVEQLAYQIVKYQSRGGWSHRDLLRKSHPQTTDAIRNQLYNYITQHELPTAESLSLIRGVEQIRTAETTIDQACGLIKDYRMTFEMVPTEMLKSPAIWEALLEDMPMTAIMRNLGRMTSLGLIAPNSQATNDVYSKLTNETAIQKARLHPLNVLIAYRTYSQGHGEKGSLTWKPVAKIKTALDKAFLAAFKYQEPSDKRFSVNFDVSGSMWGGHCAGIQSFSPAEATGALGLCLNAVEPNCETYCFSDTYKSLAFPKQTSIDAALSAIKMGHRFGRTDCALPMVWAAQNKVPFDMFVIYTDNETWYGKVHPFQALKQYRDIMGIPAKLAVCAMTSTYYSIANPTDRGMMDIVGFDASLPQIVSSFATDKL
jgi:60 kDa SS-A/Ro ribonucleoprotein